MKFKRCVNFRVIFYAFVMFLLGIIATRKIFVYSCEAFVVTLIGLIILSCFLFYKKAFKELIVCLTMFLFGSLAFGLCNKFQKQFDFVGNVAICARITDKIEEKDNIVVAQLDNVVIDKQKAGNIKIYIKNHQNRFKAGDKIVFESEVESVKYFSLDYFNSSFYRQNIKFTCQVDGDKVAVVGNHIKTSEEIRLFVKDILYKNMSEENAGISYAVLFGDKSGIQEETKAGFRDSGIIHILTVSGLHVGFLVMMIFQFLKLCRVNRFVNFTLSTFVLIFYAWLCGFSPSVVRATIMGVVMMGAFAFQRRYDALNSLGFAGLLILMINPFYAFDIGFLMSVGCVVGILFLCKLFYQLCSKFLPHKIAGYFAVSVSAQIAITPFLTMMNTNFNLLSPLANLLCLPVFSIAYPVLFVLTILSSFMPFMGKCLILVEGMFTAIVFLSKAFASVSQLQFSLKPFSFSITVIWFCLIFVLSKFVMVENWQRFVAVCSIVLCLMLAFAFVGTDFNHSSNVVYLRQYSQDCVILQNSDNETVMIGYNSLANRYMRISNTKQIDYFISPNNLNSYTEKQALNCGVKRIFCSSYDGKNKDVTICKKNEKIDFGSYSLIYSFGGDKFLGINVFYDEKVVFVASDDNFSYNKSDYQSLFDLYKPDIAILGQKYSLAKDNSFVSVSSKNNDLSSYNFFDNGNLYFEFHKNYIKARGLD